MPDMTPPADRSESAGRDDPAPEGATSDDAPPGDHTAPDGGGSRRHDGLLGEVRRLRRVDEGHVLGGVCAGLGRQLGIDPVVLRVVLAVLAPFGGVGIILYGTGWLLMPQDRGEESILEQQLGRRRNGSPDNAIFVGAVVVLGLVAVSIPWWGLPWHVPALLVLSVLGLLALLRRAGSDPADRTQHADAPGSADAPPAPQSAAPPSAAPPSGAPSAAGDRTAVTAVTQPLATTDPAFVSSSVADAMSDTRPIATRPVDTSSAENAATDDTQPINAGPTAHSDSTRPDDTRPEDTKPIDVQATDEPTGDPSGHEPTTLTSPIGTSNDPTQPVVQLGSWRSALPAPAAFWDQTDPLGLNAVPNPTGGEGEPPPVPPPPLPELRRKRFWLFATTISAAAFVCGVMAAIEESTTVPGRSAPMFDIPAAGYVAAALAVVGLGLIVGTWFGRSRALVVVGVVLALALVPLSATEKLEGTTSANIVNRPTSVGQVESSYDFSAGRIVLDLRKVPFRDGQPVRSSIDMGTGDVTVLVPPDVDVHASGDVGVGDLRLLGRSSGGMGNSLVVTDLGLDGQGGGRLDLTIDLGVGEVEVNRG